MIDDLGRLVARGVVGLAFAAHGAQKAFGWFEGPGPDGAAGFMESLGFVPGATWGSAASYNEIGSGALVALGLGGPVGPAGMIAGMVVAQASVHAKNGFFASKNGVELPLLYSIAALTLATSGYGALSLDRALGIDDRMRHPIVTALAIAGALAGAYAVLSRRDTSPPPGTLATPTVSGREHNGEPSRASVRS